MDEETPGFSEWVAKVAKQASKNAIQETIDAGVAYVVLRGNQLLKIYPDKHEEVIKEYNPEKLIIMLDGDKVYKIHPDGLHAQVKS